MTSARVFKNLCNLWIALSIFALLVTTHAQTLTPTPTPSPTATPTPEEETIIPTFETQKLARTYILDVPSPRGQITDRNGVSLAQNRLSYNLAINFPTPSDFSDTQTLSFVHEKIDTVGKLLVRKRWTSGDTILRHDRDGGTIH